MMEMFLLILLVLSGVNCCVQTERGSMTCQKGWKKTISVDLRELTVIEWDGMCLFPAGASLRLYGTGVDCDKYSFFDSTVSVNGVTCSDKKSTVTSSTNPTGRTVFTSRRSITYDQREVLEHVTTPSLDTHSVQPWTYGLLCTLWLTVFLLTATVAWLCIRSRLRRAYCCVKPRTSPAASLESITIYTSLPTLQL